MCSALTARSRRDRPSRHRVGRDGAGVSFALFFLSVALLAAIYALWIALGLLSDLARERRLRKWRREHGYPSPNDKSPR